MRSDIALTPMDLRLVRGALLGSLAFLLTVSWTPYPMSWAVKTLPIACLSLFAFRQFPGGAGWRMGLGFALSGAGDILLELPRTPLLFQAGMGAFILAHLTYFSHFIRRPAWVPARVPFMGIMTAAALSLGIFLFPRLGGMAFPILVYFTAILAMALATCLGRGNHWLSMAGAFLFIVSDALIALNMFVVAVPASDFWIMATYYPAQGLLAAGVWRAQGRPAQVRAGRGGRP